jgi:hypothetical protein
MRVSIGRYVNEFPPRWTLLDGPPARGAKRFRDILTMNFGCPEERAQRECFARGREAKAQYYLSKPKN